MIKSKVKNFIIVIFLLLMTVCLSACSEVRAMTMTNDDGTIDELVYVTLNQEEIENSGYNLDEIKQRIETNSMNEANRIVSSFNLRIQIALSTITDEETRQVLQSYYDGIAVVGNVWEENTYVIGIRFEDIDVYRYYYNITESSTGYSDIEEHFLYNTVYYNSTNLYADYHDLYDRLSSYYSSYYPDLVDSENNQLLYTYVTDLHREHSNADYVSRIDGLYYHTWVIDPNNIEENIVIYYNLANQANCLLVCLAVGLGVLSILGIIALIINKKRKKNTSE